MKEYKIKLEEEEDKQELLIELHKEKENVKHKLAPNYLSTHIHSQNNTLLLSILIHVFLSFDFTC
jgi:hypothetical protein